MTQILADALVDFMQETAVSPQHAHVVARHCATVADSNPTVLALSRDPDDPAHIDLGVLILAVYLEDQLSNLVELNTPQSMELREAVYGIYKRVS